MVIFRFGKSTVHLGTQSHCADSTNTSPLRMSPLQYAEPHSGAGVQRREAMGEGMPEKSRGLFHSTWQGILILVDILPYFTDGENKAPRMEGTCPCSHN